MTAKDWDKEDWEKLIVGGVSALLAVATLAVLFYYIIWRGGAGGPVNRWQGLAMLAVAVAIAAGVGAIIRFALAPLISQITPTTTADPDAAVRGRIAPLILLIGTIAIASLTLALIISFVTLAENPLFTELRTKVDALLSGTFATVLPVIATWVGTVLAFYFGSENFRQAAQSTREALGDRLVPSKKESDIMTPYERIARLEVDDQDKAKATPISDVINYMSQAATRVIVFNKTSRIPIYVIRGWSPFMPPSWMDSDYRPTSEGQTKKISDYLSSNNNQNDKDAQQFDFVNEDATIEDAFGRVMTKKIDDLFVTKDGQSNSPVLGWLTGHDLKNSLKK